jgi:tetratricopeptide (TPR) repeat protein
MENIDKELLDRIEAVGFAFLEKKDYMAAVKEFEKMLKLPIEPLRRVEVLDNVLGCYLQHRALQNKDDREYYRNKAIETCEEAIRIIEDNNLTQAKKYSKLLYPFFKSNLLQLKASPRIYYFGNQTFFNPSSNFVSLFIGSTTGFALFKVAFSLSLIYQVIGALIGLFFLSRIYFLVGQSIAKFIIRIEGNKEEVSDSWFNVYQLTLYFGFNIALFKDDYLQYWNSLIKWINEIMS